MPSVLLIPLLAHLQSFDARAPPIDGLMFALLRAPWVVVAMMACYCALGVPRAVDPLVALRRE